MSDLKVAANFWAAYELAGDNIAEMSRQTGIPVSTLKEIREHHKQGHTWINGGWLRGAAEAPVTDDLTSRLKQHLKQADGYQTIEQVADLFDVAPSRVRQAIDKLKDEAVLVHLRDDDRVALECDIPTYDHDHPISLDWSKHAMEEYPIGVTADNHLCSKYERLDVLNALYDRYEAYGVETVLQCGNIIEGESRFNKFDIKVYGMENQVNYLVDNWPQRKGITTKFVTADDHEGWYVQREGINIGKFIEQSARAAGREDLVHLGYMERDLEFKQEGGSARIRVIHAGGGSAYATSYTSQKYAESLQGGEKPQIVLVGHFHKWNWDYPREVHAIQPGCTQDQTPFMRKRRLQAHVGGAMLWVEQNEIGVFTSVMTRWIPFYDKTFYAYRW